MKFLPRAAAAIAAAVLFPVMAAAQQPAQRPQLTEQQREQVRTLNERHRTATETARRELADLNRQLNEQLAAAELDNSKINALRSAIVQKETALAQQRVDRLATLASVLTAEQRAAARGRGMGQLVAPGRGVMTGRGGERGVVMQRRPGMAGRGAMQGRGRIQARPGLQRELRGGRGGGAVLRERFDDARLRAEIRRLEMQLEALRRRIR